MEKLRQDFWELKDPETGEERILEKLAPLEKDLSKYLTPWFNISKENGQVYPSMGLYTTPFDGLDISGFRTLPFETILETLRVRMFFLEINNHPYRIHFLNQATDNKFISPQKIDSPALEGAFLRGLSLSIRDIGATTSGELNGRISRSERFAQGTFVKIGSQARIIFVGSANPDVWSSSFAVATMAACHGLAGIPRNGVLSNVKRQAGLAKETFGILDDLADIVLKGRDDRKKVVGFWRRNLMGVLEPDPRKALIRAEALFREGVRAFRIYSPEPGIGPVECARQLRKHFGKSVEIITGQIVSVEQAKGAQEAGADAIYVGIGGGGRCTTGVRSGTAIDWPELLWNLRGEISIPVVVEGGASDHIASTLLLGGSGIGVSRVASGGTIESPGGVMYCVDKHGKFFKPYGGEASARSKFSEKKAYPFGIPVFVEGETTKVEVSFVDNARPTIPYNLHLINEDVILALVFRGVKTISELQALDPSPLRRVTSLGTLQMFTH